MADQNNTGKPGEVGHNSGQPVDDSGPDTANNSSDSRPKAGGLSSRFCSLSG